MTSRLHGTSTTTPAIEPNWRRFLQAPQTCRPLIVKLRTRAGNVLGLSDGQVQLIVWTALCYAHALAALNRDLEGTRLSSDRNHGADRFIDMCVDYMTTEHTHVAYWAHYGINC